MKHKILGTKFWKTVLSIKKAPFAISEAPRKLEQALQETPLTSQLSGSDQTQPKSEGKIEKKIGGLIVRSELNLEQNSIFTVSTYKGKSREIIVKETKPGGEMIERKAIIGKTAGGAETGILTIYHFKVYLALLKFWEKAGRPINKPVHFTILQIIKRLELSHDGRTYARMKRRLLDMGQIPLTFINSFFVPNDGLYQTLDPFHILSYLRIYERRGVGRQQKTYGYGEFQFDRHILESLVGNHTHPLRLDVINSFKRHRDLSILLYIYLDRNLAFKEKYEIGLEKLFGHLDISQKQIRYPSDRKAKVDPVLEQLRGKELSTGILYYARILKTVDGKDYKLVCRKKPYPRRLKEQGSSSQLTLPAQTGSESAKFSSELLPLLIEKGLTQKQAAKLVAEKNPTVISGQLKYLPFRVKEYESQRKEINEPAILYESVNGNWKVPKSYLETEKEKEREGERLERERIARLEQEEQQRMEQEAARMEAHKESLNPEQRAKLRERALEEIRNTPDIKEDFVTEILVGVKENEILRSEMGKGKS